MCSQQGAGQYLTAWLKLSLGSVLLDGSRLKKLNFAGETSGVNVDKGGREASTIFSAALTMHLRVWWPNMLQVSYHTMI